MKSKKYKNIFVLLAISFCATLAMSFSLEKKIIFNKTASVPVGFYWIDKHKNISKDEVIVFVPDSETKAFLEDSAKLPKDNFLLKKVVASNNDSFCVSENGLFTINTESYGIAKQHNSKNHFMPKIRGCKKLLEDEYVVASNHPDSFDSRYFGTVNRKQILGVAIPLWLFNE